MGVCLSISTIGLEFSVVGFNPELACLLNELGALINHSPIDLSNEWKHPAAPLRLDRLPKLTFSCIFNVFSIQSQIDLSRSVRPNGNSLRHLKKSRIQSRDNWDEVGDFSSFLERFFWGCYQDRAQKATWPPKNRDRQSASWDSLCSAIRSISCFELPLWGMSHASLWPVRSFRTGYEASKSMTLESSINLFWLDCNFHHTRYGGVIFMRYLHHSIKGSQPFGQVDRSGQFQSTPSPQSEKYFVWATYPRVTWSAWII